MPFSVFTEMTNQSFSVPWQYQLTCSPTPTSSPKTLPWAAAHGSAALRYAEELGVCGFAVLPEHWEDVTQGNEAWLSTPGSGTQ